MGGLPGRLDFVDSLGLKTCASFSSEFSGFFLEFSGILMFSAHCFPQNSLQIKCHFFFLHSSEVSGSKED